MQYVTLFVHVKKIGAEIHVFSIANKLYTFVISWSVMAK